MLSDMTMYTKSDAASKAHAVTSRLSSEIGYDDDARVDSVVDN